MTSSAVEISTSFNLFVKLSTSWLMIVSAANFPPTEISLPLSDLLIYQD
jgi:hypothetical protein